jgi:hypothetical protein
MKLLLIAAAILTSPVASQPEVAITVTPAGFRAPQEIHGSTVTLTVTSQDPQGAWLGMVRLRPDVPLAAYVRDVQMAFSDDPATSVAGGRAVTREATMLGGVAVAGVPASVTITAEPGTYYLVDFRDVREPDFADRIRQVRVTAGPGATPDVSADIVILDGGYLAPATLPAGRHVRVTNLSAQFNEAMLIPVRPGTTLGDLDAFFARTGPTPFTGGPTGVVPMSPWRSAVFRADLSSGEYALVTWIRDLRSGDRLAAEGMRRLVSIR